MQTDTPALSAAGLLQFRDLQSAAVASVTERFFSTHGTIYAQFGQRGRAACRDDLNFHLEFLRPVLEFGITQPMVDYLRWLATVLASRDVPVQHLSQSLEWLAEYFAANMPQVDGASVVSALQHTKARYLDADDAPPAIHGMMPASWPESAGFETALLAGDYRGAESLLDRSLAQGHGLVDIELNIVQPALYSIGRKWQSNQITVAQEHLASAISQAVMARGLLKSPVPEPDGRRVLLACVAGNQHSIGLQMVADSFQLAGWDVQYLGTNVPTDSLIRHLDQVRPQLLGLSVSLPQQLASVKEIMSRLTQRLGTARPAVIVGGLAINRFTALVRVLGADAWGHDATAALVSASQLTAQRAQA